MTAKQELMEMLSRQPDNISAEELAFKVQLCSDILVSIQQEEEGKTKNHEEAMAILRASIKDDA